MMRTLAAFVALLILPLTLWAHEDTLITLKGKSLVGLPEKYLPAAFDSEEASLTIAGKKLVLPEFLKDVLEEKDAYTLKLSSSWYHEPEIMPPYILIAVTPKGRHFSYRVLVDMDALKILEVEMELWDTDSSMRTIPVDPAFWRDGEGGGKVKILELSDDAKKDGAGKPAPKPKPKPEPKSQGSGKP